VWDFEEGPVGRDDDWSYQAKMQRIKDTVSHLEQFVEGAMQAFTDAEEAGHTALKAFADEPQPEPLVPICVWTLDQGLAIYTTDCQVVFQMNEALPQKDRAAPPTMTFCCYCGRHLRVTFRASQPTTYWTGFLQNMIGPKLTGICRVRRPDDDKGEDLPTEVVCLTPAPTKPPVDPPPPPPTPPKDWWKKV
jgi:hypothetical protein